MARELGNDPTTPSLPRGEGWDERGEKFLNSLSIKHEGGTMELLIFNQEFSIISKYLEDSATDLNQLRHMKNLL